MAKNKFYVVWTGNKPGIYDNWSDCKDQVSGFPSPMFKAFSRKDIAEKAFKENPDKYLSENYSEPRPIDNMRKADENINKALSVDAACSGNPGVMEYQVVMVGSGKKIFHKGPFPKATVNIGEFLAIVHALAFLKQNNDDRSIYTDSITAMKWVRVKAIKTNLKRDKATEDLFQIVDRALIWLKQNTYKNKILKWNTKEWGEIPADFGRK